MAAETLTGIDPEKIIAELTKADGNVPKTAKALGVKTLELRKLINAKPALMEAALEAIELALDKAEAQLLKTMRTGPLANRLKAAAYIVRRSRRGR